MLQRLGLGTAYDAAGARDAARTGAVSLTDMMQADPGGASVGTEAYFAAMAAGGAGRAPSDVRNHGSKTNKSIKTLFCF